MTLGIDTLEITPSASRLATSLRNIGYDFTSAVADLVDNSISAGAGRVSITVHFDGHESWVRIADDGRGMRPSELDEAMRFGTRRGYTARDLGRFGLGLKTASLSQCRSLIVATRRALHLRRIHVRLMSLDHFASVDRWEVTRIPATSVQPEAVAPIFDHPGTVVLWRDLDRVLGYNRINGAWAGRRMAALGQDLSAGLGIIFGRYIDGVVGNRGPLSITVNGKVVPSWDAFATQEPHTLRLPERRILVEADGAEGLVTFRPYILPHRAAFSSKDAFDRLSGPSKWNRQQGLYFYRAGRLIQSGGWNGIRTIDEHTKLARAAIEFDPVLDPAFKINVAKMRVTLPPMMKRLLEREVAGLCSEAAARYRRAEQTENSDAPANMTTGKTKNGSDLQAAGVALKAAALESGQSSALERIGTVLRMRVPEIAEHLRI